MIQMPEEQFIINYLRSELGGGSNDNFAKFDLSNIDWNMVYERSIQWGVAPLLYKIIRGRSSLPQFSGVPHHFTQKIKREYLVTHINNHAALGSLVEVLDVLNKAGIKVILLKGAHLARFVYQDVGLRPMGDIDIMVKKEDLHRSVELLCQMGYGSLRSLLKRSQNDQKQAILIKELIKIFIRHVPPLSHPKGIRNLEIHWTTPLNKFNIDTDELWKRAKIVEINGITTLVLSTEDLLLYLCLHASYIHKFRHFSLRPFCDIAVTINNYDPYIDWGRLQLRAHEWGVEKYLYLTLLLSKEILGVNVLDSILHGLKPMTFNEKIVLEAEKRIFSLKPKKLSIAGIPHTMKLHPYKIFTSLSELAILSPFPRFFKRICFYYPLRFVSILYYNIPFYASIILNLLVRRKADFYNYNLDTFLIPSDLEKVK